MLCAETGAICEAEKQERLFHRGGELEVAFPDPGGSTRWSARTLGEGQPYYWADVSSET